MSSLGKDLAAVRKHQERTLDQVFEETRIPIHVLHSIEDGSIFSDFDENQTYIRSFVRSYAKALKINNDLIVQALNQVEKGTYSGLIAQRHEAGTLRESIADASSEISASPDQSPKEKPSKDTKSSSKKENETPDIPKRKKENEKVPPEKMTGGRSTSYSSQRSRSAGSTNTSADTDVNVNWADMGKKFSQLDASRPIWIVLVAAIVVIIAGGYYMNFSASDDTTPQTTETTPAPSDTTEDLTETVTLPDSLQQVTGRDSLATDMDTASVAMADQEEAQATQASSSTLPDTLEVLIYAAFEKLEPVRVNSDVNNRLSPYWIEHEEAMRFDFVDTIRIRGQYNRMLLLYNGHQVEDHLGRFYDRDQRYLILTRSVFEDPKFFTPAPDTLPAGVPQPTVVKERPKF